MYKFSESVPFYAISGDITLINIFCPESLLEVIQFIKLLQITPTLLWLRKELFLTVIVRLLLLLMMFLRSDYTFITT